jgi:retron-type reverse transcriptase
LESILREKIRDNRFLRLIGNLLRAGYLEEWRHNATLSGSPQGSVLSPILSNVYLDRLDRFVETTLLPKHNRGDRRRPNPAWLGCATGRNGWRKWDAGTRVANFAVR